MRVEQLSVPPLAALAQKLRTLTRLHRLRPSRGAQLARLRQILHPLDSLSQQSEDLFLELGRIVPELARSGDELHNSVRQMAEHRKEDGDAARQFTKTREMLTSVLATQREASQTEHGLVEAMTGSLQRMRQMREIESRLKELMVLLRVIQILFRTESAALPDTVRTFFWGLSDNIQTLETRMQQTFEERFQQVTGSAASFANVISRTQTQSQNRASTLAAMHARLDPCFASMESQLAENSAREQEATAVTARLAELATSLTIALQTHDIISQKLQHLNEGLDLAASSSQPSAIKDFAAVATAQVEAILGELCQVERLVRQSATEIASATPQQTGTCVIVAGFEEAHATARQVLTQLGDTRQHTLSFLKAAETETAETIAGVQPVVAAISGLNEVMAAISRQIGMVALNAQITAVHNGEGTALELLAARATEISRQTEEIGTGIASTSAAIASSIRNTAEQLQFLHGQFQSGRMVLEQDASKQPGATVSSGQRDPWLVDLEAAVEHVHTLAQHALALGHGLEEPRQSLANVLADLKALCAELDAGGGASTETSPKSTLAALEQRYTMHSERMVHQQALGSTSAADAPHPEDLKPGDIELF